MELGFKRIPNKDYHAGEGISSSNICDLLRSPAHMKEKKENPPEPTPAMIFGAAWHDLTLLPSEFENRYIPLPEDFDGRTKKGKELKADIDNGGFTAIKHDDYKKMQAMTAVVHNHDTAINLLSEGVPELSGYWYDPDDPRILCKLRMDWIRKDRNIIVDLKSSTDARPQTFIRDAYNFGYPVQCFTYLYGCTQITGIPHKDFYFIVVEKDPPHGVQVYRASDEFIECGRMQFERALAIYSECLDTGEWECYPEQVEELFIPNWANEKKILRDD